MWNKDIIITLIEFIKFSKKIYYKTNLEKLIQINDKYFKNLYYKIKRNLKNLNLEEIYEYKFKDDYIQRKKINKNKCIIFFTVLDIKR